MNGRTEIESNDVDAKPSGAAWFSDLFTTGKSQEIPSPDDDGYPMPVEKDALEYNMTHPFRGKAVILNNKYFERAKLPARNGTDLDRDNLEQTLFTLGFEVTVLNDATVTQVQSAIHGLAAEDHSDRDCVLIAVFSHGEPNLIHANDYTYKPEVLWDPFTADRCPTLAGKPKIFLIQACQGDQLDGGTKLIRHKGTGDGNGYTVTDSVYMADRSYRIPNRADFLMVYSTVPGYYSWRNSTQGSWFIQSFNKIFRVHGQTKEILSLLTHVTREVALNFESFHEIFEMDKKKQVPFMTSTLTRELYFLPKK